MAAKPHILPKGFHPDFMVRNRKPTGKVKVNWNHPMTKGLIGCYLFNEEGGDTLINLGNGYPDGELKGATRVISRGMRCLDFNGVDQYAKLPHSHALGKTNTAAVFASWDADTITDEMIYSIRYAGGSFDNQCDLYLSTTGRIRSWMPSNTGPDISSVIVANKLNRTVAVKNPQNPFQELFLNGVSIGTNSGSVDIETNGNVVLFGVDADSGDEGSLGNWFDGRLFEYYVWNRSLSDAEAISISVDRYQFLEPENPVLYLVPDSAATAVSTPILMRNYRMLRIA